MEFEEGGDRRASSRLFVGVTFEILFSPGSSSERGKTVTVVADRASRLT